MPASAPAIVLPVASEPRPVHRRRPSLLRGMTAFKPPQTGQANRHFWVPPLHPQVIDKSQSMCHPATIFSLLDGSIIYRIWLPISLHTAFAALIVALYWIYNLRITPHVLENTDEEILFLFPQVFFPSSVSSLVSSSFSATVSFLRLFLELIG